MEQTVRNKKSRQLSDKERVLAIIKGRKRKLEIKRNARALSGKILLLTLCAYLTLAYLFGVGVVSGEGMYPRLRDGDLAIFYRLAPYQNVTDVIAYSVNGRLYYGRIVALGGDTVDFSEDGQLLVNGNVQQEEVFSETHAQGRAAIFPLILAENEVFVLGDNREYAQDSRDFGAIAKNDIAGKVISLVRNRGL
jgi:signal peptidase I